VKILLTGHTGFVGQSLLRHLNAEKIDVTTVGRGRDSDVVVRTIDGDTIWDRGMFGVDAVVHLAAHVHKMSEPNSARYFEVNVGGTENLAKEAANAGVKRFVYISSVKACGESSHPGVPLSPDAACTPSDPYGRSKLAAEKILHRIGDETGMEIICLRPPLIYGPGVGANFRALIRLVSSDVPLPFGGINNRRSLIYINNLTDAIVHSLRSQRASGTFFVSDDYDVSTTELAQQLYKGFGSRAKLIRLPEFFWKLAEKSDYLRGPVQRLTGNLQIDITVTKTDLHWAPPFHFEEGIYATVQHFQNSHR
jgi:nucleoside-diphosphate-sugar epimerase